ncbi:ADP-ribosylglycohydrolase family protein [Anaerocolumna xylanovorans]|nr:ADP-ribosylglycohydrolase family protein [Anaerocolumna xylanovorans]
MIKRVKGALIGVAYGDAFGMPAEMWPPEKIREKFGKIEKFLPGHPENSISAGLKRGEVTDDTINTILVIEMLAENQGRVDAKLFIQKLKKWIKESSKSQAVVGPSTAKAIELLEKGVPMEETGKMGVTNGAAMKILPIGLKAGITDGGIEEERLIKEVVKLCMPTHYTSPAISAAVAIAAGGAIAVHGERNIGNIYEYMKKMAEKGRHYGNSTGEPSITARMEMGKYFADNFSVAEALKNIYNYIGTGISSTESIPAAAALFYLAKGNPLLCAEYAANIGGDTDTIGAMACGISGAYSSDGSFGQDIISMLESVNEISFDALTDLLMQ